MVRYRQNFLPTRSNSLSSHRLARSGYGRGLGVTSTDSEGCPGKSVAYLYHLSVREQIQFVQKQVDEEKRYRREHRGYKMFNFLLKRHRDEEKDGGIDGLCGARKGCERICTDVGMEGLRTNTSSTRQHGEDAVMKE